MRIPIDDCIPRKSKRHLSGHECQTVPEVGLAGKDNGELLSSAEQRKFDAFLTIDRGFEYEQSLVGRKIGVIIIRAKSSRLEDLLPHVPACLAALSSVKPGQLLKIGA